MSEEKTLDIYAPKGTKVKCLFDENGVVKNGYEADQQHAAEYLKPNKVYVIDKMEVGTWHTSVFLEEFPGIPFNSVHFTSVPTFKKVTVEITEEQKEFLMLIQHEDAAFNQSQAVQWCIDACMKIEKLYGIDACYISFNDIRLKENQP